MTLNKEDAVKMLYSVEVRWGLWRYGTELMLWIYVGVCGASEQS
jgi:hypothetical protein